MQKICFFAVLIIFAFDVKHETIAQNNAELSLKETFELYVQSVQNSDLEGLFSAITDNERFYFLTSNGKLLKTRQEYYTFHEQWFEETGWEMPVELSEIHASQSYGYTIATFHYKSQLPGGGTYNLDSYFTLVFHKENGMWKVIADICTPIKRYYTGVDSTIRYTSNQHYLFDIIENRRTVRTFKSIPVPQAHIRKIIEAAHFAPTAGNQQPWKFLVVQDRERLNRLQGKALSWYMASYKNQHAPDREDVKSTRNRMRSLLDNVLSAPVYIAVLVDSNTSYPQYIIHDGTLAAGYLMIAARALGYGTGFFTTFFPEDQMKTFFNIPDRYKLICFTPVGVPAEWPEKPHKKDIEDLIINETF